MGMKAIKKEQPIQDDTWAESEAMHMKLTRKIDLACEFLEAWLAWAEAGGDESHKLFARHDGLCGNLRRYVWAYREQYEQDRKNTTGPLTAKEIRILDYHIQKVQEQFHDGLPGNKTHPFGGSKVYADDYHDGTQHLNPLRLVWVKLAIEELKHYGRYPKKTAWKYHNIHYQLLVPAEIRGDKRKVIQAILAGWMSWVRSGAPEVPVFRRDRGLCHLVYAVQVQLEIPGLLADLQEVGFNHDGYPFGEERYSEDRGSSSMHDDGNRVTWVNKAIKTLEYGRYPSTFMLSLGVKFRNFLAWVES